MASVVKTTKGLTKKPSIRDKFVTVVWRLPRGWNPSRENKQSTIGHSNLALQRATCTQSTQGDSMSIYEQTFQSPYKLQSAHHPAFTTREMQHLLCMLERNHTLPTLIMPPEGYMTIWWASCATRFNTHIDFFFLNKMFVQGPHKELLISLIMKHLQSFNS